MRLRRSFIPAVVGLSALAPGTLQATETATYSYDALGRYVSTNVVGGPRNGQNTALGYDPAGNRTTYALGVAPPAPNNTATFSVTGPAAVNAGTAVVFTISKSNTISGSSTVQYQTQNGTAHNPADYSGASGSLTFRNWETVQSVTVNTVGLTGPQPTKQFSLLLVNPSGGPTIATGSAQATINAVSAPTPPPTTVNQSVTLGICSSASVNVQAGGDSDPGGHYPLVVTKASMTAGTPGIISVSFSGTTITVGSNSAVTGGAQVTYTIQNSAGIGAIGLLAVTVKNIAPGCQ